MAELLLDGKLPPRLPARLLDGLPGLEKALVPAGQQAPALESNLLGSVGSVQQVEIHESVHAGQDDVGDLVQQATDLVVSVEVLGQHPDVPQ